MINTQKGFTLLELMVVIVIISILVTIAYPTYSDHIIKTRRTQAQVALLNLAAAMERYRVLNNSYEGATLANVHINAYTEDDYYQLEITTATEQDYVLSAVPLKTQEKDILCGRLGLNGLGEKTISGTGKIEECWIN